MKKLFTLILILFAFSSKADYWTQKANFPGTGRAGCFSFAIGSNGYLGCGDVGLVDFWEYNSITNAWSQKANFPGNSRSHGIGLTINNKGYAGLGQYPLDDFYEYDPVLNNWMQIIARIFATKLLHN